MKYKILLSLIAVLSITSSINAQRRYEPNVSIGGKAGVTLSRLSFSPSVPQGMIMGYMGGISFRYMEEKHVGVIVELNVEQRGWKEKFENTDFQFQRRFTYIQLPMMTHAFFGNQVIKGFFNIGPEIGVMIGDKSTANFDISKTSSITNFPTDRRTEQYAMKVNSKFDYGISAGLGMEYLHKKKNSILLEGRFYYGLGNVFSSSKGDVFSASNSMSIMISLGYMYRIK